MKTVLLALVVSTLTLRAEEAFPAGDLNKITVKTIPTCPVIEAEIFAKGERDWEKGFRADARYAALANSALRMPVLVIYPDWFAAGTSEPARRQLVQLFLNPQGNFPDPKEGLRVIESPSMTVACYAMRGAYSLAKFKAGLAKITTHLQSAGIPMIAPPRHALYQTASWMPEDWWVSEVQVPIPSDSSGH